MPISPPFIFRDFPPGGATIPPPIFLIMGDLGGFPALFHRDLESLAFRTARAPPPSVVLFTVLLESATSSPDASSDSRQTGGPHFTEFKDCFPETRTGRISKRKVVGVRNCEIKFSHVLSRLGPIVCLDINLGAIAIAFYDFRH